MSIKQDHADFQLKREEKGEKKTNIGEQSLTVNIFCAKMTAVPLRTWNRDGYISNSSNLQLVLLCYYFVKLNTLMDQFMLAHYVFQD